MPLYSVGEIAGICEQLQIVSANPVARTLRQLIAQGVLIPTDRDGSGVTAAAVFDDLDLCRVLIVLYLNRLGLKPDALRLANRDYMNSIRGFEDDSIGPRAVDCSPDRLRTVRGAVLDGTPFYYHLYILPEYFGRPGDVLGGTFSRESDGRPDTFAAVVTIPLLPLLQPVIRHLRVEHT